MRALAHPLLAPKQGYADRGDQSRGTSLPLEKLPNAEPFDWLRPYADLRGQYAGTVAGLVSDRFEAYCKLLPPLIEDVTEPAALLEKYYQDYRPGHYVIDREYIEHIRRLTDGEEAPAYPFRQLSFRELFDRIGLIYHPEISSFSLPRREIPFRFFGPRDGYLPRDLLSHLIVALGPFTGDQFCLYFWPWYGPEYYKDPSVVYRGRLADVLDYERLKQPNSDFWPRSPTYW